MHISTDQISNSKSLKKSKTGREMLSKSLSRVSWSEKRKKCRYHKKYQNHEEWRKEDLIDWLECEDWRPLSSDWPKRLRFLWDGLQLSLQLVSVVPTSTTEEHNCHHQNLSMEHRSPKALTSGATHMTDHPSLKLSNWRSKEIDEQRERDDPSGGRAILME